MSKTRTYELKRRAERQEETRQRIVDAAVELHTTLGPSRTTVQAIAERAGVTRPTVYAHFPDARSLFEACSGHVRATIPPPDPARWESISDPTARLETALRELYGYYKRLEPLFENVERDVAVMPIIAELNARRVRYLEGVRDLLLEPWPARGSTRRACGGSSATRSSSAHGNPSSAARDARPARRFRLMVALASAAAVSTKQPA